jgi:hypothetical protein
MNEAGISAGLVDLAPYVPTNCAPSYFAAAVC